MEIESIDLTKLTPDVRRLDDMREVLFDKEFAKNSANADLYFMYRKVKIENGLVHNITVTPAKMLGKEFVKTKGHVHIGNFKEIYTVLEGSAIFLMQKGDGEKVEDAYFVKAKKGESVIIPAGYGHITINPSETEELKTGDWTSENCKSDYSLFVKMQGACYFYTRNNWIKNENYKSVPELREEQPLKYVPEDLSFLKP
jgi:glucose-6-phosphate isomerase, archaeal